MEEAAPRPPQPGGPLWEIAGEARALLMLPSALALQVAHPAVGAGVDEWSVFRTDPWGRGERSLRSLLTWVYGGEEAAAEGRRLRRMHARINGTDAHGRPYRALDPANYAWVHTTGFPVYRHGMRYLGRRPYTAQEERRLYEEWLDVGRVLGLREQDMPQTVEEFWPVYLRTLDEVIEPTPVARELTALDRTVPPPDRGPRLVRAVARACWPLLVRVFARLRRFLTVGLLPPEARRALGLEWSARDERRLRRLGRAVAYVVPLLPERLRYLPYARRARAAARTRLRPVD
ncbi:oxygenase MpaB family protein [Streptomyces sulphureus]|uniref:oxygenase MpaB family protein n=1 Tax=Streptomyces sulphureus TaxID=47758 RepID=UPI0003732577|nr:oxygenase MpaB family protein [Streptomyces sulphureus]